MASSTMPPDTLSPKTTPSTNEVNRAGSDTTAEDTAALRRRLESLPQELYDDIYNLTFTAMPMIRLLYSKYLPPAGSQDPTATLGPQSSQCVTRNKAFSHLLHVDRKSRAKYVKSHFGQQSILIVCGVIKISDLLKAMDKAHVALLRLYFRQISGDAYTEEIRAIFNRSGLSRGVLESSVMFTGLEETLQREFGGQ